MIFLMQVAHQRIIAYRYLMLLPDAVLLIRLYHLRQTGMKAIQPEQGLTALFITTYSLGLMFLD